MKLLLLFIIVVVVVVVVLIVFTSCTTTTTTSPPVFFNAQNKGFRGKRQPPKGKKAPAPVLDKPPAPAPAKDIGPKCEQGDKNCVYAGLPPPVSQCNSNNVCNMKGQRRNGQRCSYPEKNCVKGAAPDDGLECAPEDEYCVFSQTDVCQASWCMAVKGQPCKYGDRHCVKAEAQDNPVHAFENCVDTRSADNCKSNTPCVHYTCKTPGDAQRINIDNVNIKCDKSRKGGEYDVLQCKTVGNITYCGCAPLFASGGGMCPAGFTPKTMSTSNDPGALSLENVSKLGRYPTGVPRMPQKYTVCVPSS